MSSELLTILNEQHDEESDPRKLWEFIKYSVRKFSFQYSRAKSKRMRERRQDLEKRVKFYEDNLLSDLIKYNVRNFLFDILEQSLSVCEKEDKIWKNE